MAQKTYVTVRSDDVGEDIDELFADRGIPSTLPEICFAGDSRIEQNTGPAGGTTFGYRGDGIAHFLRGLTMQRFYFPTTNNFATGGYTTEAVNNVHLPQVLASKASTVIYLCSRNDRTQPTPFTAARSIAAMTAFRNAVHLAGKRIIWVAELPLGNERNQTFQDSRLSGQVLLDHIAVHNWLLAQSFVRNSAVVDPWPTWVLDPTSTALIDVIDDGRSKDGVHQSGLGAYLIAKMIQPIIEAWHPPVSYLPSSNVDVYSAGNPGGIFDNNPMCAGTAGNAGGMGTLADNHVATLSNGTGLTVALSKGTMPDGKVCQRVQVSGTPTAADPQLSIRHSSGTVAAGDVVEAMCRYSLAAGQTGVATLGIVLLDPGSAWALIDGGPTTLVSPAFPAAALEMGLRTPSRAVVTSGSLGTNLIIKFIQNVPVALDLRFTSWGARRVTG